MALVDNSPVRPAIRPARRAAATVVRVLDADRDLARRLGPVAADARSTAVAGMFNLPRGPWNPSAAVRRIRGGYGLLVLKGMLLRDLRGAEALGAELLTQGDLIGPDDGAEEGIVGLRAHWQILEPARLVVLDAAFARRVAAFPTLSVALAERAHDRARRAAIIMALSHLPRVEDRLHRLFWYLADRRGRVSIDGIVLDLPVTQEQLGHLVGARRPTVSLALRSLRERGAVGRAPTGAWMLAHDPPVTQV